MEINSVLPFLISIILLCNSPGSLGTRPPLSSWYGPNYTTGSAFQSNLQQLLSNLPQNAMGNNYFYNATYGKAPDQVYGLIMCYADASPNACNTCLFEASTGITEGYCAFKKTAIGWYDACMIRYSDQAFNATNNIGLMIGCEPKVPDSKPESLAEPNKFKDIMRKVADDLAINASRSPLRLAAGKMNYTSTENIYALAQCTRQLLSNECRMCIGNLTDFGVEFCTGKTVQADEAFQTVSCYARFALHPFYVISEAHPPWPNCSKRSREPIPTYMLMIIIGGLLVLVADIHL